DISRSGIVVARNAPAGIKTTPFGELIATTPGSEVDAALAKVGPDTTAKILFTSGSTGQPKGVINTHRMLVSNQQAIAQVWRFLEARPPVIVDWLPWHHTFGGNHNFNMMLRNGGTLYIDNGKPVPGLIEKTAANLKDVAPTLYFNVPRGYDMLIPFLEKDKELRDNFFSRLDMIFYAAAALPQNLWEKLEQLSMAARGEKAVMTSSWGATETSPLITAVHFPIDRAGVIGVPAPGNELKMVPNAGKMEMRVRGPNIMPGYYKQEELTRAAFDEDGFYMIGDAGKLADPGDPNKGVVFDGRVAEDFKLLTGTWVNVGKLRVAALAAGAPVIQDAVVTGHDRDQIGLLIFPSQAGCAKIAGMAADTPLADLVKSEAVRGALRQGIAAYNKENPASSERIARVLLMTAPPNIDANEITDKGYINQRAVLEHRADLVEKLYGGDQQAIVL
ncbi:MAG TPA: feruloyl-CoA synthase, partial [Hyphomicrobiales bacterium]|nr:feruloyl-CoA synthase [Hyphomicrobiales bacterium]